MSDRLEKINQGRTASFIAGSYSVSGRWLQFTPNPHPSFSRVDPSITNQLNAPYRAGKAAVGVLVAGDEGVPVTMDPSAPLKRPVS